MKNPTATIVESSGTIDLSDAQTMGIDDSGMATVLQILSNMYSNGSLAVVREYSSNARDSHVEAGNTDPIEVILPSVFDPRLIVQDYGVGLSRQEVMDVYAKYGASTKRDSNDQIGAFGIGSKSAFTVGNQFIVVAVKAGWKSTVLFSLDQSGMPIVQVVDHSATDERNGVRVEVGVRDSNEVKTAARNLFSTWPKGSVLVDGSEPWSVWDGCEEIEPGIWRQPGADHGFIEFVMGGVSYKMPEAVLPLLSEEARETYQSLHTIKYGHLVVVPIGDLDITPSREELRTTPLTAATINRELVRLRRHIDSQIDQMLDSCTLAIEAVHALKVIQDTMGDFALAHQTWKGGSFGKTTVEFPFTQIYLYNKSGRYYGKKTATSEDSVKFHTSDNLERTLIITDVPLDKHRRVLYSAKKIIEHKAHDDVRWNKLERYVLTPDSEGEQDWFSYGKGGPMPTISYEDYLEYVKEVFPPSVGTSSTEETRYRDMATGSYIGLRALKAEAKQGKEIYLGSGSYGYLLREGWVKALIGDARLIALENGQRHDTFIRRFPKAHDFGATIREYAEEKLEKMDGSDESLLHYYSYDNAQNEGLRSLLEEIKADITNKGLLHHLDFHEAVKHRLAHEDDRLNELIGFHNNAGRRLPISPLLPDQENFIASRLPLLNSIRTYQITKDKVLRQHLLTYINAVEID